MYVRYPTPAGLTERRMEAGSVFYAQRQRDLAFRKKLYYGGQIIHSDPKLLLNPVRVQRRCCPPPSPIWSKVRRRR